MRGEPRRARLARAASRGSKDPIHPPLASRSRCSCSCGTSRGRARRETVRRAAFRESRVSTKRSRSSRGAVCDRARGLNVSRRVARQYRCARWKTSGSSPTHPHRVLPVVVFRHVSRFRLLEPTHRRASPWTMLAAAVRPALPALASRAPAIRGARSATRVSASAEGTAFWDKMVAKASGKTTTTEVALFALG